MTVNAITDTKKGRTGIAPTYLHTTRTEQFAVNSQHMKTAFLSSCTMQLWVC